jgi:hypothetical protein
VSFIPFRIQPKFVKKAKMGLPEISVQQMQHEMQTANGKPFYLVYITKEGEKRVIARCLYGGQKGERSGKLNQSGEKRKVVSLKETGKIPTNNLDAAPDNAYRDPFISHIIQFNNYRVRH